MIESSVTTHEILRAALRVATDRDLDPGSRQIVTLDERLEGSRTGGYSVVTIERHDLGNALPYPPLNGSIEARP